MQRSGVVRPCMNTKWNEPKKRDVKRVQQEAIVLFYLYFAHTETILESVFACSGQSTGLLRVSERDRRKKFPCVPLKQTGSPAISSEANKHRVKLL